MALKKAELADLRLVVIEPKSLEFTGLLKDLFNENSILVVNKCDLATVNLTNQIKKINHVIISVLKNKNINQLISKIKDKLKNKFITNADTVITRERHRTYLLNCLDNLKSFNEKNNLQDFDKAAEDIRLATRNLGKIVGTVDVEDVLDNIFNEFCIGK